MPDPDSVFLTAVAAMIGAAFILADPIFQGLAISLVFGLANLIVQLDHAILAFAPQKV